MNDALPSYLYPSSIIAGLARDVILMRHRSFRADARACIQTLGDSFQLIGEENIPQRGPCVVTVNHYYRPGFNAPWIPFAIAQSVPAEMHWIMTSEWTFPGRWYAPLGQIVSRWALDRIAKVYGFTSMPPMPPREKDVKERAASVRAVLNIVKRDPNVIIGLAPEGGDSIDGTLAMPASGLGRFCTLLSASGLMIVPAGVYESNGKFCVRFGSAYDLLIPNHHSADEKDQRAATIIMQNIAALLPDRLKGIFT